MASAKGIEQALTWLKNKMKSEDILDSVNAEVCYNVIVDLQKKNRRLGALYNQARSASMPQIEDPFSGSLLESMEEIIPDMAKRGDRDL